jgi:hypothetical protein
MGLCVIFSSISLLSQDTLKLDACVEFVSAYNFRAIDYGNSPAIQPKVSANYKNFEIAAWGSQALISRAKIRPNDIELVPFTEFDCWLRYYIYTSIGTFSPTIMDYFYPYKGKIFFDFSGLKDHKTNGSHYTNVSMEYGLSQKYPLKLTIDYCFHNDPQRPLYVEALYSFYKNNYIIEPYIGIAKGMGYGGTTDQYGIDKNQVGVCNLGINVTRIIEITDKFKMPITVTLSMQPYTEMTWLVFKAKI